MFMNNDYNAKKLKQPQLAFSRVKVQATIALSQVVKDITHEDAYVKKSLANIILMARRDKDMRDSEFQGSVIDLAMNLCRLLVCHCGHTSVHDLCLLTLHTTCLLLSAWTWELTVCLVGVHCSGNP